MKTLGLLGGMTWHSTQEYYRLINQSVQDRLGGSHSANVIVYSFNFEPLEKMQVEGDWENLGMRLKDGAVKLERAGAEGLIICANTMHRMADVVGQGVGIPLIHIADVTADEIKKKRLQKVGLLGTRYTMEQDFYRQRLYRRHSIEVLIPDSDGIQNVHDIIYHELGRGIIREESRKLYVSVIEELQSRGAEGVVLGCTEIPLLIRPEDVSISVIDTTAVHAAAAVEFILS